MMWRQEAPGRRWVVSGREREGGAGLTMAAAGSVAENKGGRAQPLL